MQNVFGKHRQQRGGPAQQHGKQIQRHGPKHRLALADEGDAREHGGQGDGLSRSGRMAIAQARHEDAAQCKQHRAGGIHRAGPGDEDHSAQRRAANHRRLDARRAERRGARQHGRWHQQGCECLLRGHLEGPASAQHDRGSEQHVP